jgi:hypothetical protein
MQVGSFFVHLITKNTTVKIEFKMYCKYEHIQVDLKILQNICKWDIVLFISSHRTQ